MTDYDLTRVHVMATLNRENRVVNDIDTAIVPYGSIIVSPEYVETNTDHGRSVFKLSESDNLSGTTLIKYLLNYSNQPIFVCGSFEYCAHMVAGKISVEYTDTKNVGEHFPFEAFGINQQKSSAGHTFVDFEHEPDFQIMACLQKIFNDHDPDSLAEFMTAIKSSKEII